MSIRPRTKRALKLKNRRCPKCGRLLNRQRTRCPTCHRVQPALPRASGRS